jgi:hypothetical protein
MQLGVQKELVPEEVRHHWDLVDHIVGHLTRHGWDAAYHQRQSVALSRSALKQALCIESELVQIMVSLAVTHSHI